jgi:hypothetical protein
MVRECLRPLTQAQLIDFIGQVPGELQQAINTSGQRRLIEVRKVVFLQLPFYLPSRIPYIATLTGTAPKIKLDLLLEASTTLKGRAAYTPQRLPDEFSKLWIKRMVMCN